ncbi:unnamed protein product, partial [Ectocarpus sp. 8 AP-2014]
SSSSSSATGKKLALSDEASSASAAVVGEGGSGVGAPSIMEDVVEALTPRALAERALLAPLRDVGTIAGALRNGVGSSLREMAAARAAKDLSDLILQEAESSAVAAAAAAAAAKGGGTRKASPSRRGGGG